MTVTWRITQVGNVPADRGCRLAPSCRECPEVACQYETPAVRAQLRAEHILRQMRLVLRLLREEGKGIEEVRRACRLTKREIYAVLRAHPAPCRQCGKPLPVGRRVLCGDPACLRAEQRSWEREHRQRPGNEEEERG